MSFRLRLTLALLAIAAIPLALLGVGVGREMAARLDADAAERVDAATFAVRARLDVTLEAERERVASLARELAGDPRFRLAIASEVSAERRWLLDWTARAMQGSGFALLQVQDAAGRVLASGHARGDVGREAGIVARTIAAAPSQAAIVESRAASDTSRALATLSSFAERSARFVVIGGSRFDSLAVAALSPDPSVSTILVIADDAPAGARLVTPLPLAQADPSAPPRTAALMLLPDPGPAAALKRSVTRWILIALAAALVAATLAAMLLGRVISAPVVALVEHSAHLERAAAVGDLARQVNHDIKNGLAPIRNVLRHLGQVAEREPGTLVAVYTERRSTLESSVEYLDSLARNYARLSPSLGRGPTDVRPVAQEVARGVTAATVDLRLPTALPAVRADAVVLHRILDNLVSNAVDALEGRPGTISIVGDAVGDGTEPRVRISVTDTGRGMTHAELDHAFDDFFTSKPQGTGLGLSVVRRLVADVGGSVRAETTPGAGSTFTVEIPSA